MQIDWVDTTSLKPNPKNRNKHPAEQIERLAKIIKANGWRHPIIVSKLSGQVVVGHGRLEAAKLLNEPKVPVHFQDFANETEEYQFGIADNAIASWAELDLAGINTDLPAFGPELDIDLLGIKDFELEPADKYGDKDADDTPEVRKTDIRLGDLFQLGQHRLLCGDSTDAAQVERLMNGEKADMVFTDPPYGMNAVSDDGTLGGGSGKYKKVYSKIEGDDKEFDATFLLKIESKNKVIWGGNFLCHLFPRGTHWIVWDKRGAEMTGGASAGTQSDCELAWTDFDRNSVKKYVHVWAGWFRAGNKNDELVTKVHPTQKPVGLCEQILNEYDTGPIVLDPFLGSGSTLIACEKTNRKCYGCEIDASYCQVIIDRYMKFTGRDDVYLLNEDGTKTKFSEMQKLRNPV